MSMLGPTPRNSWRVEPGRCDLRRSRPGTPPDVDGAELRGIEVRAEPQDLVIDPHRSAVVVVDMQNDFCHPDGWLASIGVDVTGSAGAVTALHRFLPVVRSAGIPVVWLNWGNRPDRANLPPGVLHVYNPEGNGTGIGDPLANGSRVLEAGSWGASVVDDLAIEPGDVQVAKFRMSGFWDTPLDSILRNLDLTTLFFAGVNVDQCVLATLIDAACLGYDCVLLSDASATTSPSYCTDATLYNVRQCFGFTATTDAVATGLSAP